MTCVSLVQVLGIVGTAGALWWFVWASDNQKALVEETAAPVLGTLLSAWNWLADALTRLKDRITGAAEEIPIMTPYRLWRGRVL